MTPEAERLNKQAVDNLVSRNQAIDHMIVLCKVGVGLCVIDVGLHLFYLALVMGWLK